MLSVHRAAGRSQVGTSTRILCLLKAVLSE
jgi:hypothetical protein